MELYSSISKFIPRYPKFCPPGLIFPCLGAKLSSLGCEARGRVEAYAEAVWEGEWEEWFEMGTVLWGCGV